MSKMSKYKKNNKNIQSHIKSTQEHIREFKIITKSTNYKEMEIIRKSTNYKEMEIIMKSTN